MKNQIEALKTLWPLFLIIGSAFSTLVLVYVNVFVGDIAINTLKSDAAKVYLDTVIAERFEASGVSATTVTELSGGIGVNTTGIAGNKAEIEKVEAEGKKDLDRVESKAERIAQILMEE